MQDLQPILVFGEVLFDCFPDAEPILGGAPLNVAWHLQAFGVNPELISAVGNDELGKEISQKMQQWGMSTQYLQIDPVHPSGVVDVSFVQGEPQYNILRDVAYDHISSEQLPSPTTEHFLYQGSLAARCPVSRQSLLQLRQANGQKQFIDVNLRAPWWEKKFVQQQIYGAYCVKLNQHELHQLSESDILPECHDERVELAHEFKLKNNITNLVVTLGDAGVFAIEETGCVIAPESPMEAKELVDTVGAGDAFSAILLLGLVHGWDWLTTLHRAQSFASFIVSQRGATSSNLSIYNDFRGLWGML